jgi:hypothetical protein
MRQHGAVIENHGWQASFALMSLSAMPPLNADGAAATMPTGVVWRPLCTAQRAVASMPYVLALPEKQRVQQCAAGKRRAECTGVSSVAAAPEKVTAGIGVWVRKERVGRFASRPPENGAEATRQRYAG